MKYTLIASTIILLFSTSVTYAKGGHANGTQYVPIIIPDNSCSDNDIFSEIRKDISTGYIIYGTDTVLGIITFSDNTLSLKTDMQQDTTYTYNADDTNLRVVTITDNNKTMVMKRLDDGKLYRVFHEGRLSIYDRYFSFNYTSKEFYNESSKVIYSDGHSEKLNRTFTIGVKKKLVNDLNKAYGLALKPSDYKGTELLLYISTLD